VLNKGKLGETYNIGGWNEKTNLEVVRAICSILDDLHPQGSPHANLITFVKDRPGHDQRYAIDASKIERDLGWKPQETFETGLRKTVEWYLANDSWVKGVTSGEYRDGCSGSTQHENFAIGKNGQVGWELQRSLAPLGEIIAWMQKVFNRAVISPIWKGWRKPSVKSLPM